MLIRFGPTIIRAPTDTYEYLSKYVGRKVPTTMLGAKRPVGVAPEVNLKESSAGREESTQARYPPWL